MHFFQWSTSLVPQYRPVIDGHFLPQTPEELLKSGHVNANNFFTGATMDEGLIAGEFFHSYVFTRNTESDPDVNHDFNI